MKQPHLTVAQSCELMCCGGCGSSLFAVFFTHVRVEEENVGSTASFDRVSLIIIRKCRPVYLSSISDKVRVRMRMLLVKLQQIVELAAVKLLSLAEPVRPPCRLIFQLVLMCLLPPGVGLWVGEECRALGSYLPLGTRSQSHVDSDRPKPGSALGQVCRSSQGEDESLPTVWVHIVSIVDTGIEKPERRQFLLMLSTDELHLFSTSSDKDHVNVYKVYWI